MLSKLLGFKHNPKKRNTESVLKDFLSGGRSSEKADYAFTMSDFDEIRDKVAAGIDPDKLAKLVKESGDMGDVIAVGIPQQYEYLMSQLPVNSSIKFTGETVEGEPSDFEKSKFIRQFRVLADAGHIVDLIASNSLSGLEVDAMQEYYPEALESIRAKVLELLASKKYELNRFQNYQLSILLGVSRLSPDNLAALQASFDEGEASGADIKAEQSMSEMQELQYK